MEHIQHPSSPSPSSPSILPTAKTKNRAGIRTGTPLSQLSRLNISGLHAELKPKVLKAIQWFLRCHVALYPGILTAITFEGTGDTTVNRRRQRNRNVIGVEPVLPGVVHFNNQYSDHVDAIDDVQDQLEITADSTDSNTSSNSSSSSGGGLFVDATGHVNNIFSGLHTPSQNGPADAVPADFHSQYYLLSRNPDESCELDFMSIVKELAGQLQVLDLSRWSWSVITQQALDMIPTEHLSTLRFHPRTRIMASPGSMFLKKCRMLKVLNIHAYDSDMLSLDNDTIPLETPTPPTTTTPDNASSSSAAPTSSSPPPSPLPLSDPISLTNLSLTGNVPSVLRAVQDAIRLMPKSLDTIDLTAHLDGYLSREATHRLMDWNTALSTSSISCLSTLQLHGHLAMTFEAPLLLEHCPTLRRFGLTIKSYTSSSFTRTEDAHVLPRFMVTPDHRERTRTSFMGHSFMAKMASAATIAKAAEAAAAAAPPRYHLKVLELEGPWILTERDVDQIGRQISGLVYLNLVGCRFYPTWRPGFVGEKDHEEEEEEEEEEETEQTLFSVHPHPQRDPQDASPVIRLVERVQDTLKTLRIHRRGLEGRPRRDSAEYTISITTTRTSISASTPTSSMTPSHSMSTLSSFHSSSSSSSLSSSIEETRAEPVLAFKKRFPNVKLQIREKQHENSFVLAPPVETLRRIHHRPPLRSRTSSLFSDFLGQPSSAYRLHEFSGQSSLWRRARNAVPFFKRHKTYSPNGFENGQIRSWGRGGMGGGGGGSGAGGSGGAWRRGTVSLSRLFQ
ncbi:hypothetical protein BGX31_000615 [Mortierella sp. GBA43]|nr:hypothetical protein BGX31_000615 [Mortierella sp. GBA43]